MKSNSGMEFILSLLLFTYLSYFLILQFTCLNLIAIFNFNLKFFRNLKYIKICDYQYRFATWMYVQQPVNVMSIRFIYELRISFNVLLVIIRIIIPYGRCVSIALQYIKETRNRSAMRSCINRIFKYTCFPLFNFYFKAKF